jgi:hypothetical protein
VAGTITLTVDGGTAANPLSLSIDPGALTLAGQTVGVDTGAFDYYIGPSGTVDGDGTISDPWHIDCINTHGATYAGKSVGLLSGTYHLRDLGVDYIDNYAGNMLEIENGSSGSPTIIKSVSPRGAVIDADFPNQSAPYPRNAVIGCTSGGYVVIDGLHIKNAGYRAVTFATGAGYIIQNCFIEDQLFASPASGSSENSCAIELLISTDGATIKNNRFEGCGAPADSNRHACVQAFGSADTLVEYNTCIGGQYGQNGVHIKNTTPGNTGEIIRFNHLDMSGCSGTKTPLRVCPIGADPIEINNNVMIGGEAVIWENAAIAQTNTLWNNTIVNNGYGGAATVSINSASSGSLNYYNNIYSRSSTVGWRGDLNLPPSDRGTIDYNFYDNSPTVVFALGSSASPSYSGLSAWQAVTDHDDNSIADTDPGFVATGADAAYYQLSSGSVCKDAGRVGGTGSTAIDMGAWGGATSVGSDF